MAASIKVTILAASIKVTILAASRKVTILAQSRKKTNIEKLFEWRKTTCFALVPAAAAESLLKLYEIGSLCISLNLPIFQIEAPNFSIVVLQLVKYIIFIIIIS